MIHKLSQNAIEYAGKTVRKTAKKAGKNIGKTSTSTQRAIVYAPTYQPIVRKGTYSRFKEDVLDISKPATTIERANRIAQAMGVGELRISDLGLANYINKGLYEYTRITKKKLPKIDIITENPVGECNSRAIMSTGIYNGKRFIYANKNQLIRNSSHNMGFYAIKHTDGNIMPIKIQN